MGESSGALPAAAERETCQGSSVGGMRKSVLYVALVIAGCVHAAIAITVWELNWQQEQLVESEGSGK